ncbi:MAG: flagellar biosynthetic protein FliO [Spirochaetales bacterium]|nr:flagellar biosynthetic protein FliO [Spirochaetales bacterium]
MKKLIILFLIAMTFSAFSQEKEEKDFPVIDESTLTFDAPADEAVPGEEVINDSLTTTGITTADYLRMVFFLIIVIVIIWLFIKLLRRYSGNRFGDQDMINIMGSQALTGETSLHVVEVENSYYLLGASQSNVALVTEIKDQETIDALKLKQSQFHDRKGKSFWEMVSGMAPTPAKEGEAGEASEESLNFLRSQRNRLKDL